MSEPQIIRTNHGDLVVDSVSVQESLHHVKITIELSGYGRFDEETVRGLLSDQLMLDQPEQLSSGA
jgi:hypothetical protein